MKDKKKEKKQSLGKLKDFRKKISEFENAYQEGKEIEVQKLLDAVPFYIMLLDEDHGILLANKAIKRDLGLDPKQIIGAYCPKVVHGLEQPYPGCPLEEAVEKGHAIEREFFDADTGKWVNSAIYPLNKKTKDGKEIFIHFVTDITKRKLAEEQARLRQEQLFQADKMVTLGTLVSGVAHEINNPISFIVLNASILQKAWDDIIHIMDEYYRENDDFTVANMPYTKIRERIPVLLSDISGGAKRVKSIVRDLKDFARQKPPTMEDMVDINKTIKRAIGLVDNLIKKYTNRFSVDFGSDIPIFKGNAQHIEQLVINLLVNACQALSDSKRSITVTTAYDDESSSIVIEIHDQGAGMPPEILKRIKDPFFTTKRDTGGTGLGLAISERIIHGHSGTLDFSSDPAVGTTAKICFPISSSNKAKEEQTR